MGEQQAHDEPQNPLGGIGYGLDNLQEGVHVPGPLYHALEES
jgi:hypothetical protein